MSTPSATRYPAFFEENILLIEAALERFCRRRTQSRLRSIKRCATAFSRAANALRPMLCLEASRIFSAEIVAVASTPACALEFIHTYSLIHDDLPALDNDDLRRGKPTCHKKFGEANAILAGDGLLTLAFETLRPGSSRTHTRRVASDSRNSHSSAGTRRRNGGRTSGRSRSRTQASYTR